MGALWHQRDTVVSALDETRRLGGWTIAALVVLVVGDRIVRGLTMRRAVGARTSVHGVVLHDVGAAASYGLPAGGVVGTGMRFRVARGAGIPVVDFLAGVTAFGVAMSAASWLLPAVVLGAEVVLLEAGLLDVGLLALSLGVLVGMLGFWAVVLRSDRMFARSVDVAERAHARVAGRLSRFADLDVRRELLGLRERMRCCVPRLPSLIAGAVVAQLVAATVLLVALHGLGAAAGLGMIEYARVFFVTRVLSALVPTPGGVGVVEAGLSGALVAAGVPAAPAVGAVLVYRLGTFVVPILTGTACWLLWCRAERTPVRAGASGSPDRNPAPAGRELTAGPPAIE